MSYTIHTSPGRLWVTGPVPLKDIDKIMEEAYKFLGKQHLIADALVSGKIGATLAICSPEESARWRAELEIGMITCTTCGTLYPLADVLRAIRARQPSRTSEEAHASLERARELSARSRRDELDHAPVAPSRMGWVCDGCRNKGATP